MAAVYRSWKQRAGVVSEGWQLCDAGAVRFRRCSSFKACNGQHSDWLMANDVHKGRLSWQICVGAYGARGVCFVM